LAAIRWRDYSVVMQSAMNALNPVKSIGAQFRDVMQAHGTASRTQVAVRSAEVLRLVGIDPIHLRSYPHQLSSGMRQRAMIAMALLFTPGLLEAFPSIRGPKVHLTGIPGSPPDLAHPPAGCRFHPRCPLVHDRCLTTEPELYPVDGELARCLLHAPEVVLR